MRVAAAKTTSGRPALSRSPSIKPALSAETVGLNGSGASGRKLTVKRGKGQSSIREFTSRYAGFIQEGTQGPHWGLYTSGSNPQPKFVF